MNTAAPIVAFLLAAALGQPARGITAEQAAPFLGGWTVSTSSAATGPQTLEVSITRAGEGVRATVKAPNQPESEASNVRLSGRSLLISYNTNYPGMTIPTVLILTPDGAGMRADMSILDGQLEMSGTAAKGSAAATAAPSRGGGQAAGGGGQAVGRGGPPPQPQAARVVDVMQMMAALPDSAPAKPQRPRRILVLARAQGFVHSSIPLAARTIEALGQKTGAWTSVITYNPADINADNLKQYDAVFLASTTGTFLDDPADQAVTKARRDALLEFVRGGKGLAAIHAATDSYHGAGGPPSAPQPNAPVDGGSPLWPDFNHLINGYFKWHWLYPTQVAVKIDDPDSPINAPFTYVNQGSGVRLPRPFTIVDEVYTFNDASWSRSNAHVLTSIDYAKMPAEVKALEPAPKRSDSDYALSYIRREGSGHVFVEVLGHDESIYKQPAMLAHILAGVQYALGDLQANDAPSK
jgi:type 1 glutamine amidotransferase